MAHFIGYTAPSTSNCDCGTAVSLIKERGGPDGDDVFFYVALHDMPANEGCDAHVCPNSHMSV